MKTPWSNSAEYARFQNASSRAGLSRTSSRPMAQLTARSATSIVQVQLTPMPTGLASTKSSSSWAISAANRSSPVSWNAWPSVAQCWQRASSHGYLMSAFSGRIS